ncbi:MAG: TonB family protein [Bacteroidota bacterium]
MSAFFIYLIKTTVVFTLLLIPYLFTKNTKFFTINRFYLLGSMLLSLCIPLLKWEIPASGITGITYMMNTIEVNAVRSSAETGAPVNILSVLFMVYVAVSAMLFIRFLSGIIQLLRMISKNKKTVYKDHTLVVTGNKIPFSFLHFLFLPGEQTDEKIIAHEKIHIHQRHSLDVIASELFLIHQWINPFAWWMKKELLQIHEYIADDKVIKQYDRTTYSELLLCSALSSPAPSLAHRFHTSTLKNRIVMMKKKNNRKVILLSLAAALPIAALASAAFSGNATLNSFWNVPSITWQQNENPASTGNETVNPQFKGGDAELAKFIGDNLKYPESAKKDKKEGKVFIGFIVDKNGKVKNATIKRGFDSDCDKEALRVIKMMPDWTPGSVDGKPADVEMVLPIKFKL